MTPKLVASRICKTMQMPVESLDIDLLKRFIQRRSCSAGNVHQPCRPRVCNHSLRYHARICHHPWICGCRVSVRCMVSWTCSFWAHVLFTRTVLEPNGFTITLKIMVGHRCTRTRKTGREDQTLDVGTKFTTATTLFPHIRPESPHLLSSENDLTRSRSPQAPHMVDFVRSNCFTLVVSRRLLV